MLLQIIQNKVKTQKYVCKEYQKYECLFYLLSAFQMSSEYDSDHHVFSIVALDTGNVLPKRHMFELLTVMCVYSQQGYERLMTALKQFQVSQLLFNPHRHLLYARLIIVLEH